MRIIVWASTLFLMVGTIASAQVVPVGEQSAREFWMKNRTLLDERDQRGVRAQKIFKKVLAAADKRPGPPSTLIILDEEGYPWARSLVDGTILLTRGALSICFDKTTKEVGDARLAFVLGHELSHQVNGDFWHFFFYQGTRPKSASDSLPHHNLQEVIRIARETDSVRSKEIKADQYGVVYASLAGYNMSAIFDDEPSRHFFAHWAAATNEGLLEGVTNREHPLVAQRHTAVRLAMKRVAAKIETFDKGVAAYDAKSYSIAKYYFEDFLTVYQSREAYNNLGLVYYQIALGQMRDAGAEVPHTLSLILDSTTLARSTMQPERGRMSRRLVAADSQARYLRYAETAADYFGEATRRDHTYAAAYSNEGCALYVQKKYNAAVGVLNRAIAINPNLAEAYNNRAVAMTRLAESLGVSLESKIRADLRKAVALRRNYVTAQKNLQSIEP